MIATSNLSPCSLTASTYRRNIAVEWIGCPLLPRNPSARSLQSGTVHQPHARVSLEVSAQLPADHRFSAAPQHVRAVPQHDDQLAAELQQRSHRGRMAELQTDVGGADEPPKHRELRREKRVFADHGVHFATNQMERIRLGSLCRSSR